MLCELRAWSSASPDGEGGLHNEGEKEQNRQADGVRYSNWMREGDPVGWDWEKQLAVRRGRTGWYVWYGDDRSRQALVRDQMNGVSTSAQFRHRPYFMRLCSGAVTPKLAHRSFHRTNRYG